MRGVAERHVGLQLNLPPLLHHLLVLPNLLKLKSFVSKQLENIVHYVKCGHRKKFCYSKLRLNRDSNISIQAKFYRPFNVTKNSSPLNALTNPLLIVIRNFVTRQKILQRQLLNIFRHLKNSVHTQ